MSAIVYYLPPQTPAAPYVDPGEIGFRTRQFLAVYPDRDWGETYALIWTLRAAQASGQAPPPGSVPLEGREPSRSRPRHLRTVRGDQ